MDPIKYQETKEKVDKFNAKIDGINSQVDLLNAQRRERLIELGLDPDISEEELAKHIASERAELETLQNRAEAELEQRAKTYAELEEAIKNYGRAL